MNGKQNTPILLITLRTDTGGGPKHVSDLLNELKNESNLAIHIASPLDPPHGERLKSMSIRHLELPSRAFSLSSFFKLWKFIRENRIKIVHSHGRGAGLYARLVKLLMGSSVKVVHTFHGIHQDQSFKGRIKFAADRVLARYADSYINVSHDEQIEAKRLGLIGAHSTVIPNGVNLNFLKPDLCPAPTSFDRLGYYARNDYQKGYDIFYRYLDQYFEKHPESKLKIVIAGTSAEESGAPQKLLPRLQFLGVIEHPVKLFSNIDFLLSCSRWEGMPLAVLEAMAYGRLCLLSNVVGHRQFLKSGTAAGYDLNSFPELENLLQKLAIEPQYFMEIRRKGQESIQFFFNTEQMAKNTLTVYKDVLPSNGKVTI